MNREARPREDLHRVCAHVLGRRRFAVSGRFGLRAGPAGISTPAYGDGPEVLRVAGPLFVREEGAEATHMAIDGSTLRALASFAGADIDAPFECGKDTPAVGDPDEPLTLPDDAVADMAGWFAVAWLVLDRVAADLGDGARATTIQLWPEHFDAATTVTLPGEVSVNLGFSPGDDYEPDPYVYVGPWGAERPGSPAFWNAPFGASRRRSDLADTGVDLAEASALFLTAGLSHLTSGADA